MSVIPVPQNRHRVVGHAGTSTSSGRYPPGGAVTGLSAPARMSPPGGRRPLAGRPRPRGPAGPGRQPQRGVPDGRRAGRSGWRSAAPRPRSAYAPGPGPRPDTGRGGGGTTCSNTWGRIAGTTGLNREFTALGGGEPSPEGPELADGSYHGHRPILCPRAPGAGDRPPGTLRWWAPRGRGPGLGPGAPGPPGPPAPPGSSTDRVQRARLMARPSPSVRRISQTWTVRPARTGVAVATRVPSREGSCRWLMLSSIPTTRRSGPAARDAPKLAADSARRADTPPWRIP